MVHGGGWAARDKGDMDKISRELVRHGYAVLNINYRFAPVYRYPSQLMDLQQALKWIANHSSRYDLDLDRISAWGYSSGAHLVALLAGYNYTENSMLEQDCNVPRIRAVVAGGVPSDLRKFKDGPILKRFLGGSRDQMPGVYADASPVFHVSTDDPPVFLYHGNLDLLVRVDHSTDYHEALRDQGVDSGLYLHAARGHATMFLFGGDAREKAIRFIKRTNAAPKRGWAHSEKGHRSPCG